MYFWRNWVPTMKRGDASRFNRETGECVGKHRRIQLSSEVLRVAFNVGRSHQPRAPDETDRNDQPFPIKTRKTFSFFTIFIKSNEARVNGCDLLHWEKPEQPNDTFSFTLGK